MAEVLEQELPNDHPTTITVLGHCKSVCRVIADAAGIPRVTPDGSDFWEREVFSNGSR
jgi:hypothetical protein